MAETFYVLFDGDELLEVLVLPRVEDGIVDDDSVNDFILVGGEDMSLEFFPVYLS